MNSEVYVGNVWHRRNSPTQVEFRYPLFWLALEIEEFATLPVVPLLFSAAPNRRIPSLLSLRPRDYISASDEEIPQKVWKFVGEHESASHISRVVLVTTPRLLGYVFNPVSFYLCFDGSDEIVLLICQVRNTFGEMHLYPVTPTSGSLSTGVVFSPLKKEFSVSPFITESGEYRIQVARKNRELSIQIVLNQEDRPLLETALIGQGRPLSTTSLSSTLLKHPFACWLTMPRILWQALRLVQRRSVPLFHFSKSSHPRTSISDQGGIAVQLRLMLLAIAQRLRARFIPPQE